MGAVFVSTTHAGDWSRFRGPNGSGVSSDKAATPVKWSDSENLKWKIELPGPGLSSPIVVGDRVFVTAWSGYGVDRSDPGDQENLKRHLVCVDRKTGKELWSKTVDSYLPEDRYRGMFAQNGYASHTPVSDGERVYAFFGKTGVIAYDLKGKKLWSKSVGTGSGIRGWGSASSPIIHDEHLIVTASAESEALIALDRKTGKQVWKQEGDFGGTWGTPIIADLPDGNKEIVIAVPYEIWGLNAKTGKLRWYCDGIPSDSMCASPVTSGGVVYAVGGRGGGTIAVKAGGRKDVNKTHVKWTGRDRGRIGSPIVVDGRMYWVSGKVVSCIDVTTGKRIYQSRLEGSSRSRAGDGDGDGGSGGRGSRGRGGFGGGGFGSGQDYSSLVAADGKGYYVSRSGDAYVFQLGAEFKQLAHNRFSDGGEFSATPALSDGQLFIRSSKYLYCVSKK
jgi:outer membrane protein assembly factor BamB